MTEALHTAVRRYCQERIAYWHERYARLGQPDFRGGRGYPDEHRNVFPRYNLLEAILVEVERLRPEAFSDVEGLRNRLWRLGQRRVAGPPGDIEQRAMQEERDLFCAYLNGLNAEALAGIAPLPYRRTLHHDESQALWERLGQRFGVIRHAHWYPLHGEPPRHTVAFEAKSFHRHVHPRALQSILEGSGVSRLWELREFGPEYEIDLALFEPLYNGAEGYWTADAMDWLVYASHQGTVTVAGAWLLSRLQAQWPTWRRHQLQG